MFLTYDSHHNACGMILVNAFISIAVHQWFHLRLDL